MVLIPKGSTLTSLAKQYGTTVDDLIAANAGNPSVKNRNLIIAGGELKLPSSDGSLEGTMTTERTLPEISPTAPTREITPTVTPGTDSSFANLRSLLAQTTRLAASQGPSAQDYLNLYSQAGVPLTSPSAISSALNKGTISRAGIVQDVYKSSLDLINEQEQRQQDYVNTVMSGLPKSFLAQMSGKDFDEIKSGNVSPELKQRIQEAIKLDEQSGVKPPSISEQLAAREAGYEIVNGQLQPISETQDVSQQTNQEFTNWEKSMGSITQGFDTPVSYFNDGRTTHSAIDIAGALNSPVSSPVSGTVVEAQSSKGWGTSVVIQDAQGNKWRMAHFNDVNIQNGDQVQAGQIIGKMGNTGYVLKGDGTAPTPEELKAGRGVHLHIEVKDAQGNLVNPETLGVQQPEQKLTKAQQIAQDIFNGVSNINPNTLSTKIKEDVSKELAILKTQAKESGDLVGLLRSSAGGKDVDTSFLTSFDKALNVVYQIGDLQQIFNDDKKQKDFSKNKENTNNFDLNPIWGKVRKFNPWDMNAQQIKASLQAIVPNLARGIYGEVGVLTDNDIKNYSQTLPTLTSTEEVRQAVLGMTVRSVQRAIENKLKTQVSGGRDVSGYIDQYLEVKKVADELLGVQEQSIQTQQRPPLDSFINPLTDFIR